MKKYRHYIVFIILILYLSEVSSIIIKADPVQTSKLGDLVVYIDNVHGRSDIHASLAQLGIKKITFMNVFSKLDKNVYYLSDVIVLHNVFRDFEPEELQDLREWVEEGGRLIIICTEVSEPLKVLLSEFNVSISEKPYSGVLKLKGFLEQLGQVSGQGYVLKGLSPLAESREGAIAVYGKIGKGKIFISTSSVLLATTYLEKIFMWLAEDIEKSKGVGQVTFRIKTVNVPFNQMIFKVVYSDGNEEYLLAENSLKITTRNIEYISLENLCFSTSTLFIPQKTVFLKPVDRNLEVGIKVYAISRLIITTYNSKPVVESLFPVEVWSTKNMYYISLLTFYDYGKELSFKIRLNDKTYNFTVKLYANTTFIAIGSLQRKKIRVKVVDENGKPVRNAVVYCYTYTPRLDFYSTYNLFNVFSISDSNGIVELPYSSNGIYIVAFKDYENTPCIDLLGLKYIDIPSTNILYTVELKKVGVLYLANVDRKKYSVIYVSSLSGKAPWLVARGSRIYEAGHMKTMYAILPVGRYKITLQYRRRPFMMLTNKNKGYSVHEGHITFIDFRFEKIKQKRQDILNAIKRLESLKEELYYGKIEGINLIELESFLKEAEFHLKLALYYLDKNMFYDCLKEYEIGLSYLSDVEYGVSLYIRPLFVFSLVLLIIIVLSGLACANMIGGERSLAVKITLSIAIILVYVAVLSIYHPGFKSLFNPSLPYFREKVLLLSLIIASVCYLVYWDIPRYFAREYFPEKPSKLSIAASAFNIGLRNLRRRKLRTALSLLTVFFMIFSLVAFTSVQPQATLSRSFVTYETNALGNGLVYQVRYLSEGEKSEILSLIKSVVGNESKIVLRVMSLKGGFEGRAMALFMKTGEEEFYFTTVSKNGKVVKVRGILGVEPSKEKKLTLLPSTVVEGRFLLDNDTRGVLISRKYTEILGVSVGDTISVLGYKLRIVGIFDEKLYSEVRDLDGSFLRPWNVFVKAEIPTYSRLTSPEGVLIVHIDFAKMLEKYCYLDKILIITDSPEEAEKLAAVLVRAISDLPPYLCENGIAYVVSSRVSFEIRGLDTLIVIIIGSLITANLMIAEVYERRREISTYTAVGMTPSHVKNFFLAQAFLLTFTGGGLGYLAATFFINYLSTLPAFAAINISITPMWAILAFVVVIAVNLIASSLPARKASLQVVPSFKRKWELKLGRKGVYEENLPFRVHESKIKAFVSSVDKKIRVYYPDQGLERTEWRREYKRTLGDGTQVREIQYLIWSAMGGATSQSALVKLMFTKAPGGKYYSLVIRVEPKVKGYKYKDFVYRIVDRVRKICLETNVSLR